jgi:hypothetical protein
LTRPEQEIVPVLFSPVQKNFQKGIALKNRTDIFRVPFLLKAIRIFERKVDFSFPRRNAILIKISAKEFLWQCSRKK